MTDLNDHSTTAETEASEQLKQESSQNSIEILESQIETLKEQLQNTQEQNLRNQADWSNLLKRKDLEKDQAVKHAHTTFFKEFIFVLDSLESGILSIKHSAEAQPELIKGMELIEAQVMSLLEKFELNLISPDIGSIFDPNIAEAMSVQPREDCRHNAIIMVVQKGYRLKERLIRPARVIVAKNETVIS